VSASAKPAASAAASVAKPAASGAALTKVRYGLPTATADLTTVGIYWGIDNGFFKDEGLDVTVTGYAGSPLSVRAMLSKEADIVMTGTNAFDARANAAPIKIISSPIDKPTDAIVASKSINSLKDMAGKSFAISTPNSPSHIAAQVLAQRNGVPVDKVQFVPIGGPADRFRALLAGKVDMTSLTVLGQKTVIQSLDAGEAKLLTPLAKEFPELPLAYDVVTDDTIKGQSALVGHFVKAEIKGYRWAKANPDKAAAIAAQHIPDSDGAVLQRSMKDLIDLDALGVDGGISQAGIEKTEQTLVETKALAKPVPTADVLDASFAQQAVKELG
jgi:NitT/TauT family transport system substrate-binding protein